MRTHEQQLNYERLELITNPQPQLQIMAAKVVFALRRIWKKGVEFLNSGTEPHIYQTSDASGEWWYAYDPITGKSVWLSSEAEVMEWLDTRHSRRGTLFED